MKLYIIGNGFDRAHGLPTSYYDFRKFLQSTEPQFLSTFEDKYYLAYSATSRNRNILWNDFERNLASISADVIVEEVNSMDLDLEGDYYGYEDTLYYYYHDEFSYIEELQKYVKRWIRSIKIRDLKPISSAITNSAKYITFNYTGVLERIYHIGDANILHIHGSLRARDLDPIIGHRDEKRMKDNSLRREKAANEFDEATEAACKVIDDYYRETYKNTAKLSIFIVSFLQNTNIDEIEVIGHSIADVDQDYFKLVDFITGKRIHWIVNYYEDANGSNEEELQQNMLLCGVDKKRIVMKNSKTFFDLR